MPLSLEDSDLDRLNEHPDELGTATTLDALIRVPGLAVAIENKLTESLGSCSQASTKQCPGIYGLVSDLKNGTRASCRLEVADGRRLGRTYWSVMRELSSIDAYPMNQPCAFSPGLPSDAKQSAATGERSSRIHLIEAARRRISSP